MTPDLGQIYDSECAFVWRTLRRFGVLEADLPDAVHDVFDVAFRKWDRYDAARPLRGWLFGIARRVASSTRRKQGPQVAHERPVVAGGSSPEGQVAARELLLQLLDGLDDDQRDAFVLHDLEGFSGAEIAEMVGVPRSTVYSRIRLAREQLAAHVRRLRLRRAV